MPYVEDNGFLFLESPGPQTFSLPACELHGMEKICSISKNFSLKKTKARNPRRPGRSYGEEELRVYRMTPKMGPPDLEIFRFPGDDTSWAAEFDAFLKAWRGRALRRNPWLAPPTL